MLKKIASNPWQSQYGLNPFKQSDITDWTPEASLVYPASSAATLVTKNYIYVLGGQSSNSTLDTIQRASFDNDGNLTSDWSNVGTLPVAMENMDYVAAKGRFYLIGGINNSGYLTTVYSAPINSDGTLGSFREETPLPIARSYHVNFIIKDKLYVVGGGNGSYIKTIYRATINNNGTLSNWETLPDFPINFGYGVPLVIKDRVYIVGANDNPNHESIIYHATYDSDGNIGPWSYVSNMPDNIFVSSVLCTDNYVFSIGGYTLNNYQYTNASYRAPILTDGSIGDWVQISNAPIAAGHAQVAIAGNKIYFIGGWNNGGNLDTVYSATFTSGITDYTPFYTD
jgi:hypothetical protein